MNENENLNMQSGNTPNEPITDYNFGFSNQTNSTNPQTTVPLSPAVESTLGQAQPVEPVAASETNPMPTEPMPEAAPMSFDSPAEQTAPAIEATAAALEANPVPTEPMPEVAPISFDSSVEQMTPATEEPVQSVAPATPLEQVQPVEPVAASEVNPMPMEPMPEAAPISFDSSAEQTASPIEGPAPITPLEQAPTSVVETPAVQETTTFENIQTPPTEVSTEVIQMPQQTPQEQPKETKNIKNTLIFGLILVAIVALFIIILPFTQRIGG
ncbi:MAG: hypothetical protein IKE75_03845 [Bacilli bacterium]|nr:hypothetical protein [Bacilli bacterium]